MKQVKLSDETHKQLRQLQELSPWRYCPLQHIVEQLIEQEHKKKGLSK